MRAVVVLGGDLPGRELLTACAAEADLTIAADRGLTAFHACGLLPDYLIGDMDSVAPEVLSCYAEQVEQRRLPCEKDDTDGFEALYAAIGRGADEIVFLGALGGRLAHALANLMLLVRAAQAGVRAELLDEQVRIFRVDGHAVLRHAVGDTVSILPLGTAEHITLTGFHYPLTDGHMDSASSLGISNVVEAEQAEISCASGDLLVFHWYRGLRAAN